MAIKQFCPHEVSFMWTKSTFQVELSTLHVENGFVLRNYSPVFVRKGG